MQAYAQVEEDNGEKVWDLMNKKIDSIDNINRLLEWSEIRDGLYRNKNGDIGFLYTRRLATFYKVEDYNTVFEDTQKPFKDVIDTATFRKIAGDDSAFFKDKHHVYRYLIHVEDGPAFDLMDMVDYNTFIIIDECYAKDKNYLYYIPVGPIDVDITTVKVLEGECFAKDKNGYYRGRALSEEQLQSPELKVLKEKIDKL